MTNPVGTTQLATSNFSGGLGYICIPNDITRDKYIKLCYLQNRVTIKTEDGGFFNRVMIDPMVLNFIEFPVDNTTLGSQVIWINLPPNNVPVIVGRIPKNDHLSGLGEHKFKINRLFGENFVEFSGDPKNSILGITVSGTSGGEIDINIINSDNNGLLKLNIQGNVELDSQNISFNQSVSTSIKTTDDDSGDSSSFIQTTDENHFENNKFTVNKGTEPITLGNQTREIFNNLFDILGQTTTTTALGQMPILTAQQIVDLKNSTDKILSQIAFTD